ncbi:MAG: TOBE domain-containing protein [Burkholderiales bacterium]|nr:TOBE domain-containing protein [Burkholderiales bacterium]
MARKKLSVYDALGQDRADRRIAILREIGTVGSISQAARNVGISYKAAWQAIDTLTNLAGVALVERAVGGVGGGGARLTDAARELLAAAGALRVARAQVVAQAAPGARAHAVASSLGVRTSMRNQWPCVVQSVKREGPLVQVELAAQGDEALRLHARITRESAELLGLAQGMALQVLCKATAVRVRPRAETGAAAGARSRNRNEWAGRVARVARGALGDEVVLTLDGGLQLVGFAPTGSGLRVRSLALASAEANALVLMVPD